MNPYLKLFHVALLLNPYKGREEGWEEGWEAGWEAGWDEGWERESIWASNLTLNP